MDDAVQMMSSFWTFNHLINDDDDDDDTLYLVSENQHSVVSESPTLQSLNSNTKSL